MEACSQRAGMAAVKPGIYKHAMLAFPVMSCLTFPETWQKMQQDFHVCVCVCHVVFLWAWGGGVGKAQQPTHTHSIEKVSSGTLRLLGQKGRRVNNQPVKGSYSYQLLVFSSQSLISSVNRLPSSGACTHTTEPRCLKHRLSMECSNVCEDGDGKAQSWWWCVVHTLTKQNDGARFQNWLFIRDGEKIKDLLQHY